MVAEADQRVHCLTHLAEGAAVVGEAGANAERGRRAQPRRETRVVVPVGTEVTLAETGLKLADLDAEGDSVVLAYGGEGGSPLTNERHNGLPGDGCTVLLELKSIADVGLVGFPNAGKSSVLGALSRARPKVADYPFTTVRPNVGVVQFPDLSVARVADIPGLIRGASENVGMGHAFLRHIERTRALLYVVDVDGFQLSARHPRESAIEAVVQLGRELSLYQPGLQARPALLAVNKIDLPGGAEGFRAVAAGLGPALRAEGLALDLRRIVPISAATGLGLPELKAALRDLLAPGPGSSGPDGAGAKSFVDRLYADAM